MSEINVSIVRQTIAVSIRNGSSTAGSVINYAAPILITAATSILATNKGKNHICTGVTTDYTLSLPTTGLVSGDLFGFEISSAMTKLVTIDAQSGQLIDGQQIRILWAKEKAVLKWDGTNWQKISGLSIPMSANLYPTTAIALTANALVLIPLEAASFDHGGLFDSINNRINIARTGTWQFDQVLYFQAGPVQTDQSNCLLKINTSVFGPTTTLGFPLPAVVAGMVIAPTVTLDLVESDFINFYGRQFAVSGTRSVYVNNSDWTRLTVLEIIKW